MLLSTDRRRTDHFDPALVPVECDDAAMTPLRVDPTVLVTILGGPSADTRELNLGWLAAMGSSSSPEALGLLHHHRRQPPRTGAVHVVFAQRMSEFVVDQVSPVVGQIRAIRVGGEFGRIEAELARSKSTATAPMTTSPSSATSTDATGH